MPRKKKQVVSEKEIEVGDEQEAFAEYIVQRIVTEPLLMEKISEKISEKVKEEFKDVLEVAKVQRKHSSFQEMCEDCKFEEELEKDDSETEKEED